MTISRSARAAFTVGIVLCNIVPALSGTIGLSPSVAAAAQYPGPPPPVPALPTDIGGPPQAPVDPGATASVPAAESAPESAPTSQTPQSPVPSTPPAVAPSASTVPSAPAAAVTASGSSASSSTAPGATVVHALARKETPAAGCRGKRGHHSKTAKGCHPARTNHRHDKSASAADTGIIGTAFAPLTTCNGSLDAWADPAYKPGYLAIAPDATPGSGFSTQLLSTRLWVYQNGQWSQGAWNNALVSQPDPNSVSVGGSFSGIFSGPWLFEGQVGEIGYMYVVAEYYWNSEVGSTPGQWYGPEWGQPTSYTQYWDNYAHEQSAACYVG